MGTTQGTKRRVSLSRRARARIWRAGAGLALGLGLVGAGTVVGAHLHGATNPAGGRGVVRHPQQTVRTKTAATEEPGSTPTTVGQAAPGLSIDMSQATGETCKPPAAPCPGHPQGSGANAVTAPGRAVPADDPYQRALPKLNTLPLLVTAQ